LPTPAVREGDKLAPVQGRAAPEQDTRAEPGRARASAEAGPGAPPRVPGYSIGRVLGKGGMGVVWEGFEHRLERKVAVKVHSGGATPERVAQLWSEARLAARIAHPGVVSVHDVGTTLDGHPYYTMDLIEGASLRAALTGGPLSPARALAIGIEIADAVAAAHERGIVHCDLKPGNILLDTMGRVKILDFGIAERIDEERDRILVRGTPQYMAPELLDAEAPTVASDLYAIGVILYEMIAGQRPFPAESMDALVHATRHQAPPPLSRMGPLVHTDFERACLHCLAKRPEHRFPSARALCEALTAILEGRKVHDEALHDRPPEPRSSALAPVRARPLRQAGTLHLRFQFAFKAPPERVWLYVADNDRLAKVLGQRPVAYAATKTPEGQVVRTGTMGGLGGALSWEEPPYAWVRHRELSAYRSYLDGPLRASWTELSLTLTADGGTQVTHAFWILPRGPLARLLGRAQIELFLRRRLRQAYRRIAARLAEGPRALDVLDPLHRPNAAVRARVESSAAQLGRERHFPQAILAELSSLLLYAPDRQVERLRPFALADAWGARREEVLDLFLHAASVGLVDIAWDLICAECRLPYETVPVLSGVARQGVCTGCGAAYEGDLAQSIELIFSPHRSIRKTRPQTYCVQSPMRRPHILAQQVVGPGERRTLGMELRFGAYRLVATRAARAWDFAVSAVGSTSACSLRLTPEAIETRLLLLRAGEVAIEMENATGREEIFRIESDDSQGQRVTAKAALCHPSFHAFFSGKVIAHGEHLAVSRMAFLFVDIKDRARLFAKHGDAGALQMLNQIEAALRGKAEAQQGSIVQVDAAAGLSVAAFADGAKAVKAAFGFIAWVRTEMPEAKVRAAVHQGRCIAMSSGERLRYFGETLSRGASLLAESAPGRVAVSPEIAGDRAAARVILEDDIERVVSVASPPEDGLKG
jgi:serine/threonine protein kinase